MNIMNILLPCVLLVAVMALSVYVSKAYWPYHPGKTRGYITDMLVYYFVPVLPLVVFMIGFRVVTQFRPDLAVGNAIYIVLGIAIVGLLLMRRLPLVVAAQNRVREARNARFEASKL